MFLSVSRSQFLEISYRTPEFFFLRIPTSQRTKSFQILMTVDIETRIPIMDVTVRGPVVTQSTIQQLM